VRASPLSRPGRGVGGEGFLPSPALGEGPGVRVSPLEFGFLVV